MTRPRRPRRCPDCRAAFIGAVDRDRDRWVPVLRCLDCGRVEPVRRPATPDPERSPARA